MKKLLLIAFFAGCALPAAAQSYFASADYYDLPPRHYLNAGYVLQRVDFDDPAYAAYGGKAEWGASVEMGQTWLINRIPWGHMLRLGVDLSWFDLHYAQYKDPAADNHYASIGVQVGPSLTISPAHDFDIKLYARYAPAFAVYASQQFDNVLGGYAGYFNAGGSISWRMISVGCDTRLGLLDAPTLSSLRADKVAPVAGGLFTDKRVVDLPALRVYLGLRF